MTNLDTTISAYHEAGHFIVHASIGVPSAPRIDLSPQPHYHPGDNSLQMWAGLEGAWAYLGGPVAEWMYSPGASHPLDDLWLDGLDDDLAIEHDLFNVRCEVERLFGDAPDVVEHEVGRQFHYVHALLRRRWRHVEAVAALALASPTSRLGPEELARWVGGKLPRWRRFEQEDSRWWEVRYAA